MIFRPHAPGFVNDGEALPPIPFKTFEAFLQIPIIASARLLGEIQLSRHYPETPVMLRQPGGEYYVLGYLDGIDIPELPEFRP